MYKTVHPSTPHFAHHRHLDKSSNPIVIVIFPVMLRSLLSTLLLSGSVLASVQPEGALADRAAKTATVVLPSATILGNINNKVESFGGIPYAEPPEGKLRLRPPKRLTRSLGTFDGTGPAGACPQMVASTKSKDVLFDLLGSIANLPFVQTVTGQSEDCLTITVARPEGTKANAKLPVLFWIFGGGFEVIMCNLFTSLLNHTNLLSSLVGRLCTMERVW
jgi:hypothetical protein